MTVAHVELLVEEPSMEEALRALLPGLLGGVSFQVYRYQGKMDLLSKLPVRLRGYSRWLPPNHRVVVVVDRDDDDCHELKARLEQMAGAAGLRTRTQAGGGTYQLVNRLAIEELEAWYFGDWEAVRAAYPRVSAGVPRQQKYRNPDAIPGGTWEAFARILLRAGYFRGGLPKIEVARAVAPNWKPSRNTSRSFRLFRDTIREMAS